jgi:hypothetical protein
MESTKLPSNSEREVFYTPYTVEMALQTASISSNYPERALTKFLRVIQQSDNAIDPLTMTAQDRKAIAFDYFIKSMPDEVLADPTEFTTQNCDFCGKQHTFHVSWVDFIKKAQIQYRKDAFETIKFKDISLRVVPLSGKAMEEIEVHRIRLKALEKMDDLKTMDLMEEIKAELKLLIIRYQLDLPPELGNTENWLKKLNFSEYGTLTDLIDDAQEKLDHGISFSWKTTCPIKGVDIVTLLPFRASSFLQRI